jgi:hypothetical protein
VQHAEEAAAEAEAQRLRHFRLVLQRGVVELELFQRLAQLVVFAGLDRIQTGEHLRLDFLEAGQRLSARRSASVMVSPTLAAFSSLMPADDEADLARRQAVPLQRLRREHADLIA